MMMMMMMMMMMDARLKLNLRGRDSTGRDGFVASNRSRTVVVTTELLISDDISFTVLPLQIRFLTAAQAYALSSIISCRREAATICPRPL